MKAEAWLSEWKTAGIELPPRSRIITTTLGLHLGLAVLIALQATVAAILVLIGGLHIPSKISAVDFSRLAFAADDATAHCFCHGFTQLVQQHEFL
jgi:hypothetical protein